LKHWKKAGPFLILPAFWDRGDLWLFVIGREGADPSLLAGPKTPTQRKKIQKDIWRAFSCEQN
jgi:hypothetical protein